MNFLLRMLLGSTMGTGFGDRFSKDQTGDLSALTTAMREEKANPESLGRLKDAFAQLKGMHQDPQMAQATQPPMSPFDVPLPQDRPQPQPQMAQAHPFAGMF